MSDPARRPVPEWRSADLGSFFAVDTYPVNDGPGAGWRPLAELWSDEQLLLSRVGAIRAALATDRRVAVEDIPLRVAGSVFQLDLLARMLSPALSLAVHSGEVLDLGGTFWRYGAGPRLAVPEPAGVPAAPDRFAEQALAGPAAGLVAALRRTCSLSTRIGWGNAASALNGAAIVLGALRPALAARSRELTAAVLALPPLDVGQPEVGGRFRRRSCCLLYRISAAGRAAVCADCVLLGA